MGAVPFNHAGLIRTPAKRESLGCCCSMLWQGFQNSARIAAGLAREEQPDPVSFKLFTPPVRAQGTLARCGKQSPSDGRIDGCGGTTAAAIDVAGAPSLCASGITLVLTAALL